MIPLRVLAAAQTIPRRGDVDGNVEDHIRLVRAAAVERVQMLVFPELSLTGYELDLASDLAFTEHDPRLAPLAELASACQMTLVVGAPVRLEARLYIGALILSPNGSIAVYTKHHLGAFPTDAHHNGAVPPAEATVFAPGTLNPLVRLDRHVAAVAVCADTSRPSHPERAAARGAKAYLASMFVIPADLEKDTTNLQTYATRHSMAVAFANYGGPSGGLPSAGRSAIWSDEGELVAELGPTGAGLVVAIEGEARWTGRTIAM